ncbi:hypothetical protein BO86DRAFT_393480 [Aspergillus japonicus CBS 114.51]|uniref:HTH araC/xylS-type domain-containing protein n=1 Tax=Aspergillus japonicus CBS 114.51 TaxID=1448312 RepID=A0A8T8WKK0_ASPJA|nr:hypothetical protein BO86DRAFT_393480 [Aspergillus japonicus CBS 114.51]RAH76365.1 hypothetical protein BO86DRAFT_393480 [Aspergillus japonicus CBS 114.51]
MDQKPPPLKLPPRLIPPLPSLACASARWQAVVKRDPTAITFVYAVLTTKIYCRAACPARLARRANVRFYDLPSQAERAGFRACKRCRPETLQTGGSSSSGGGGGDGSSSPQVQLVHRACQTIASTVQSGSKPTLHLLATEAGLTSSHFHRVFRKVMGVTPGKYVAGMMEKMKEGKSYGASRAAPEIGTVRQLQPCGGLEVAVAVDGISRSADVGEEEELILPWNDFDAALIAAETGFVSMQEVQPLGELHAWHGVSLLFDGDGDDDATAAKFE